MSSSRSQLRPCLVLGTGFHRWVLGESMAGSFKPLLDWNELLLAIAREMRLPLDRTDHDLTLHWERLLVVARQNRGFERNLDGSPEAPAVYRLESSAKKSAARILADLKPAYPINTHHACFPLQDIWGAVVSLNFDAHWLPLDPVPWVSLQQDTGDLASVRPKRRGLQTELVRLNHHATLPKTDAITRRLWFPNGYIGRATTLRLGLREFGFQPVAIHEAFVALKMFERKAGRFEQRIDFVRESLDGGNTLNRDADNPLKLPLTWVTEMLYRPVCFAGVGMSEGELGLWWLMVQRARNLAGVHPKDAPPAAILVKHDDARLPFWRTRPCGIEPLICTTWDEGWAQVSAWGEAIAEGRCEASSNS